MDVTTQLLIVLGMAIVTSLPRFLPLLLFSSRSLSAPVMRWLEMVPPSVLAALLANELLLQKTESGIALFISSENIFLLAAVPVFLVSWLTKSFFGTVAAGMAGVALLRYLGA